MVERQEITGMCPHGNFPNGCELCEQIPESTETGDLDLRNREIIEEILVSGSDSDLKKLREHYKLSEGQIDRFRHFARLRNKVHESMSLELQERLELHSEPTHEELALGTYIENIEPQVRDTVLNLRKKGYSTWESGFMGVEGEQRISFTEELPTDYQPSAQLITRLGEQGVTLNVESTNISFTTEQKLALDEMRHIWEEIEADLPTLEGPAKPSVLPSATAFRE